MGLSQASTDNTEYYLQSYTKYGPKYWSRDGRKTQRKWIMQPWAKKTSRTPRNMDSYKILDFFWHVTHLFTLLMFFCRCFLLRNSAAFVFTDWYIERPGLNLERNFCNSNKWQVLFQSWDYIMLKKGRNDKKKEKKLS